MSTERDLLRDYARREAYVAMPRPGGGFAYRRVRVDEVAEGPFLALLNVIELLETCDGMELTRVGIEGLRDAIRKGLT